MKPSWRTDKRKTAERGYGAQWRRRRAAQLEAAPLCCMCEREGRIRLATVADHIKPHRGDPVLFAGPLQSLCASHHSGYKQALERTGRAPVRFGADGYPLDGEAHPWAKK